MATASFAQPEQDRPARPSAQDRPRTVPKIILAPDLLNARTLSYLQRSAGNAAVSDLLRPDSHPETGIRQATRELPLSNINSQVQRCGGKGCTEHKCAEQHPPGEQTSSAELIQLQRLPPDQQRSDPNFEQQRKEAIEIVQAQCAHIQTAADSMGVAPEAIAGAILWEALENPYTRPVLRLGPGKVHPREWGEKSEAEKVEEEHLVPASKDASEREQRLQQPGWSVTYIAAIMSRHAENYRKIAGVDISQNVGVLCTLYQGGHSEDRARKLAARRKKDPTAQPVAADTMGPWVVQYTDWIRQTMGCFRAPEPLTPIGQGAA